jgi:hypothetical protein
VGQSAHDLFLKISKNLSKSKEKPNDYPIPMQKPPHMSQTHFYTRQVFNKYEFCILINVIEMDAGTFSDIMVVPYSGRYTEISKLLFVT